MALESFGTILYVAKISYQSDNWFGNCQGGPKLYTDTDTNRQTHTHTHTHTHTEAYFISLVFLRKCRNTTNKTKDTNKFSLLLFKIAVICYNTRLTTIVHLPETISKGLLWNLSQNDCHTIFDGSHVRKSAPLMALPSGVTGRTSLVPDQGRKEGEQAQLPCSEPGISAH